MPHTVPSLGKHFQTQANVIRGGILLKPMLRKALPVQFFLLCPR